MPGVSTDWPRWFGMQRPSVKSDLPHGLARTADVATIRGGRNCSAMVTAA
jgi:hypothetical protein